MAHLGNLSGLFFSHQLQPDDDLEKAKFATRSEAARYAASIRWKGNVKGDDDGVDTPEKIAKDAVVLRSDFDDFLQKAKLQSANPPPMTPEQWQNYTGSADYVDVFIAGVRNTVPSRRLLQLEQEVCALGERARALALARTPVIEILTTDKRAEIREARRRLVKDLVSESGDIFGGRTGVGDSKTVDITFNDERYETEGFVLALTINENSPDFVSKIEEFFNSAPKVPLAIKKKVDALVAFDRSDKTEVDGTGETVPMPKQTVARLENYLARQLRGALEVGSAKWIQDLTGKPVDEWNQARAALGNAEEMDFEVRLRQEKARNVAYAEVMREMGIEMGLAPTTQQSGKWAKKLQADVSSIFPSRAVAKVTAKYKPLFIKKTSGGGSWNTYDAQLNTDGTTSTNLHEFMHAVTYADPVARAVENAFLERRRMGDPSRTREQYDVSERITAIEPYDAVRGKYGGTYVKDDLSDGYAGRKYFSGKGNPTESLTRGLEFLVADTHGSDDDDHRNMTMGVLIMLGQE